MPKFVIDEDMPRSLGKLLKNSGYEAMDIRDHGLRGADDSEIFKFALENWVFYGKKQLINFLWNRGWTQWL